MDLSNYTIEELEAEIKRRKEEIRKQRGNARKGKKTEYAYIRAVITAVTDEPYCRREFSASAFLEDVALLPAGAQRRIYGTRTYHIVRANFTKDTAPRVGDIVKIRAAKSKHDPDGFGLFSIPYICEIIERKTK